jgi:hypothetical protein
MAKPDGVPEWPLCMLGVCLQVVCDLLEKLVRETFERVNVCFVIIWVKQVRGELFGKGAQT